MIKHLRQPDYYMCGHTVAAMLAGTTVARVRGLLGHGGPTTWREVYSVLHVLGVVCAVRMVPVYGPAEVPATAVLQLPGDAPALHHFVAVAGGHVYDPARRRPYPLAEHTFELAPVSRIAYCAEVLNGV